MRELAILYETASSELELTSEELVALFGRPTRPYLAQNPAKDNDALNSPLLPFLKSRIPVASDLGPENPQTEIRDPLKLLQSIRKQLEHNEWGTEILQDIEAHKIGRWRDAEGRVYLEGYLDPEQESELDWFVRLPLRHYHHRARRDDDDDDYSNVTFPQVGDTIELKKRRETRTIEITQFTIPSPNRLITAALMAFDIV